MNNHITDKNGKCWDDYSDHYLRFNHSERILNPVLENPERAFHKETFSLLKKHLGAFEGKNVLVPSSGDNLAVFAFALMGANVVSADLSQNQLDGARKMAERIGIHHKIRFVKADTMRLQGIEDNAFDLVYTSNGVHVWIDDLKSMYENILRVIKPGGLMVMYDVHPFQRPFDDHMKVRAPYDCVGPFEDEWNITFHWRMMDIVNAIAFSGLRILEIKEMFAEKDYERPFFIGLEDLVNGVRATKEEVDEKHDWTKNPNMALPHWLTIAAKKE